MKKDSKEYKLVTSMWILSCIDQPPQMTYEAIEQRCENGDKKTAKSLVSKFPELFQEQIPRAHLDAWKIEMKEDRNRSKWIARSTNIDEEIAKLSLEDVFRNRFRNSINAEPTTPELIKWGLDYLNEHFSIKAESTERFWNRIATIFIPVISIIIVGFSGYSSYIINNSSIMVERLRFGRDMLYPNYFAFLNSLSSSLHFGCFLKDKNNTLIELSKATSALYSLSPFLESNDFNTIKQDLLKFRNNLLNYVESDNLKNKMNQAEEIEEEYSTISIHISDIITSKFTVQNK
jgi:hypothetical protein